MRPRTALCLFALISLHWASAEVLEYDEDDDENGDERPKEEEVGKTSSDWTRKLELDVLSKISYQDPPFRDDKPLSMQFMFSSVDHITIDEKEQIMSVNGRYCVVWVDDRIKWSPLDYSGVSDLHVGPYDVWTPKMRVYHTTTGVMSSWDAAVEKVHLFVAHPLLSTPAFVVTCPRFFARVGCSLDLSAYPHDEHVCSFTIGSIHWKDIELSMNIDEEKLSLNMKHILTRNDSRPTVADFSVLNISSEVKYYDGINVSDTKIQPFSSTVAFQTVRLRRHAPYFYHTVLLPSLLFALLNGSASLMVDSAHSLALFLLNIFFIGMFLEQMLDRLPLHYDQLPNAVLFWIIQLSISVCGLVFITFSEIARRHEGIPYVVYKLPPDMVSCGRGFCLSKIFSFSCLVLTLTVVSTVMFLI